MIGIQDIQLISKPNYRYILNRTTTTSERAIKIDGDGAESRSAFRNLSKLSENCKTALSSNYSQQTSVPREVDLVQIYVYLIKNITMNKSQLFS